MEKTTELKSLLNRLSRAEGQIKALREALEADNIKDCKAFISQIKAARSALKGVSEQYVLQHIKKCQAMSETKRDSQIEEVIKILASD